MDKLTGTIQRLFVLMYMVYCVSPIIGAVDNKPSNGLSTESAAVTIKLLIVDRFLDALFDVDDESAADDNAVGDDFLVRKFRSLPTGHSLGKLMSAQNHSQSSDLSEQQVIASLLADFISREIPASSVPVPFEGYGTLHSGLAPPSSLS